MLAPEILAKATGSNTPLVAAVELAKTRKDIWPSREDAHQWLAKRLPYKTWDPRILQLYVVCYDAIFLFRRKNADVS